MCNLSIIFQVINTSTTNVPFIETSQLICSWMPSVISNDFEMWSSTVTQYFERFEMAHTVWKVFVFGVFLVCIFPHSDWIQRNTEYRSVFSPNADKYGPEKFQIRTILMQWYLIVTFLAWQVRFPRQNLTRCFERRKSYGLVWRS